MNLPSTSKINTTQLWKDTDKQTLKESLDTYYDKINYHQHFYIKMILLMAVKIPYSSDEIIEMPKTKDFAIIQLKKVEIRTHKHNLKKQNI